MDAKTKRGFYILAAIAVALSLVAGGLGIMYPQSQPPASANIVQLGTTNFDDLAVGGTLAVTGNSTMAGTLGVTGNTTLSGDLAVTGDATMSGAVIQSSTTVTPTAGQTITPTVGLYIIGSSGAVSITLPACTDTGQMVSFYGEDANTVTINDSNIRSTDGNAITFGQYDVVQLLCAEAEWNHVSKSANQ